MQSPNFNPMGDCEEGYMGPMCTVCIPGYEKSGPNKCTECKGIGKYIGLFILSLANVVIMIIQNLKQSLKDK